MNFFLRSMCSRPAVKAATHYESLGIAQNSTQGEVKAAYYKLSMLFHPDKNQGDSEAAGKFRDISEAYKVLGNTQTRKLYDKGLLIRIPRYETSTTIHPRRESTSRAPYAPPPFSTPVYNFDEWSRSHYGATFRRQQENKRRREEYRESRRSAIDDGKVETTTFVLLFILGLGYDIIVMHGLKKEFDALESQEKEKQKRGK